MFIDICFATSNMHIYVYIWFYMYMYMYIRMYIYNYKYKYMYVYMSMYRYMCLRIRIRTSYMHIFYNVYNNLNNTATTGLLPREVCFDCTRPVFLCILGCWPSADYPNGSRTKSTIHCPQLQPLTPVLGYRKASRILIAR